MGKLPTSIRTYAIRLQKTHRKEFRAASEEGVGIYLG